MAIQNSINNRVMAWSAIDAAQVSMAPNNGYIDLNSGQVGASFLLPTVCQIGDRITLVNNSRENSFIAQSDGQQIMYGDIQLQVPTTTTLGITGSLEIAKLYSVTLLCVSPNVTFIVESYTGALIAR